MSDPWAGYTPRRWQGEAFDAVLAAMRSGTHRPLVHACTGCHEAGQAVLMFDGSTKLVEDVVVGDRLMGPDSTPRTVLALCRGEDEMFEVRPVKGSPWRVNGEHVLSLVDTRSRYSGRTRDVTVRDWMRWGPTDRAMFKLFRVGVDFAGAADVPVDPYFIGALLGDGSTRGGTISITTMDDEIAEEVRKTAERWGCSLTTRRKAGNRAKSYDLTYPRGTLIRGSRNYQAALDESDVPIVRDLRASGMTQEEVAERLGVSRACVQRVEKGQRYSSPRTVLLHDWLRELGIMGQGAESKHVPAAYRLGSRAVRAELLAGLIDTDGSLSSGSYDYISKSVALANDVAFIARSIGLAAYVSECQKSCQDGFTGTYFRVSVSGDLSRIPTRTARKRADRRQQIKSVGRTGLTIVPLGYRAPFYGFTLDGDQRYLLDDFTVTHNSGKSRLLGALAAACKGSVLVTTPTQALVDQLASTLDEHCPGEVGCCYQHAWQSDRRVVVSCIPSLPAVLAERPEWACWLADEAHRLEGIRARGVRGSLHAQVAVGVTATPYTSDWRGLVLWDAVVYSYGSYDAIQDGVLVPWRVVRSPTKEDVEVLCQRWAASATGPGIVSAVSVADADACAARLSAAGIPAMSIHGYLPREEQAKRLVALAARHVRCLVHCQLLTEGVDLPWLRWLILRRVVSSPVRLVQEVGRVLRVAPEKTEAVLYDPHDALGEVGLVHGARLEDVQRTEKARLAAEPLDIPELPGLEGLAGLPRSRAVSVLEGWVTDSLGMLRAAGKADPPTGAVNPQGPWRQKRATDRQRAAAQRWMSALQHLPTDAHRAGVELLLQQDGLRAGTASDVLTVLVTLARKRTARSVPLPDVCAALEAA